MKDHSQEEQMLIPLFWVIIFFLFLLKRSTPFLSTFFERDLSLGLLALHPNTKKERERESKRAKRDKALGNNNE